MSIEEFLDRLRVLKIAGETVRLHDSKLSKSQYRWFFGKSIDFSLIITVKEVDKKYSFSVRTNPTSIDVFDWYRIDENFRFEELIGLANRAVRYQLLLTLSGLSESCREVFGLLTGLDE